MAAFVILGALSFFTLTGPIRGATMIFLGGLALKTWIAKLKSTQEAAEAKPVAADAHPGVLRDKAGEAPEI